MARVVLWSRSAVNRFDWVVLWNLSLKALLSLAQEMIRLPVWVVLWSRSVTNGSNIDSLVEPFGKSPATTGLKDLFNLHDG
jgi:hypothetical protein